MHVINVFCTTWSNYEIKDWSGCEVILIFQLRKILAFEIYTSAISDFWQGFKLRNDENKKEM